MLSCLVGGGGGGVLGILSVMVCLLDQGSIYRGALARVSGSRLRETTPVFFYCAQSLLPSDKFPMVSYKIDGCVTLQVGELCHNV